MSPVPCLQHVQPWTGGQEPGTTARPTVVACSREPLPLALASSPCLPWTHNSESLVPLGLAEAGATDRDRAQAGPLPLQPFGAACLGRAAWALRAGPQTLSGRLPVGLQEPRLLGCGAHTQHCQLLGCSVCARVTNMIAQTQRRLSVCTRARPVCVPCVCFKSPLGGNSFFLPFLFGCDLGEIDSQLVRWMLTVPLIYRVTYAK